MMDDVKFEQSCLKFRQSMNRENMERRRAIVIETPLNCGKARITSVESNLPKLEIQDIITSPRQHSDSLAILVKELGINKDEEMASRNRLITEILSHIQPIQPGRRARFTITAESCEAEIYIRRSLDVWIILGHEKLVFPKPRISTCH